MPNCVTLTFTFRLGYVDFLILLLFYHFAVVVVKRGQFGNSPDYFVKNWKEYQEGFNSNGELWLGLDLLHSHTASGTWRLDVWMQDWDNSNYTARYEKFKVENESSDYQVMISSFDPSASTLGDSLISIHSYSNTNGMKFSTKDRDNDKYGDSCSVYSGSGGFWYNDCGFCNPNGRNDKNARSKGITWLYGGTRGNSWKSWKSAEFTMTKTAN